MVNNYGKNINVVLSKQLQKVDYNVILKILLLKVLFMVFIYLLEVQA